MGVAWSLWNCYPHHYPFHHYYSVILWAPWPRNTHTGKPSSHVWASRLWANRCGSISKCYQWIGATVLLDGQPGNLFHSSTVGRYMWYPSITWWRDFSKWQKNQHVPNRTSLFFFIEYQKAYDTDQHNNISKYQDVIVEKIRFSKKIS